MSLTLFLRFFYLKKYFYLLYLRHRLKSVVSSSSISLEKSSIKTLVGLSLQDTDGSSWLANSRSSGYFSQPPSMRSVTGCSNRPWRVSCRPSTSCTMTFSMYALYGYGFFGGITIQRRHLFFVRERSNQSVQANVVVDKNIIAAN